MGHERLKILSHGNIIHGLLEVLCDCQVAIFLGKELGSAQIALNILQELGHSDIVLLSQIFGHGDVVFCLIEEFRD